MMTGKVRAFFYLVRQAKGVSGKLKLARVLGLTELIRSRRTQKRTVTLRFHPFTLCFHTGQGELTPYREISDVVDRVLPPDRMELGKWTILDIGANIGLFSLFCRHAGQIVALEPNPTVAECLAKNFRENQIRGTVVRKAIFSEECEIRMNIREDASVLSTISDDGNVTIPATTIDRLVEEFKLDRVDLLKLDVEGHELDALAGAKGAFARGIVKRVYLEFYGDDQLKRLDETLALAGFKRAETFSFNALYKLPDHH